MKRSAEIYGMVLGKILLDDLDCSGREENLLQCSIHKANEHDCTHHEDAGVKCGGKNQVISDRVLCYVLSFKH